MREGIDGTEIDIGGDQKSLDQVFKVHSELTFPLGRGQDAIEKKGRAQTGTDLLELGVRTIPVEPQDDGHQKNDQELAKVHPQDDTTVYCGE